MDTPTYTIENGETGHRYTYPTYEEAKEAMRRRNNCDLHRPWYFVYDTRLRYQ